MTTVGCVSNAESGTGCVLQVARCSGRLAVRGLRIAAYEGTLSSIGEGPLPASRASIATDCSDRLPFGACYGGNLVATTPIDPDGAVRRTQQVLHTAAQAHATWPAIPMALRSTCCTSSMPASTCSPPRHRRGLRQSTTEPPRHTAPPHRCP